MQERIKAGSHLGSCAWPRLQKDAEASKWPQGRIEGKDELGTKYFFAKGRVCVDLCRAKWRLEEEQEEEEDRVKLVKLVMKWDENK